MKKAILAAAVAASLACMIPELAARQKPAWLSDTPLVLVSNHDSMPIFRRRVGGNTTYQAEDGCVRPALNIFPWSLKRNAIEQHYQVVRMTK